MFVKRSHLIVVLVLTISVIGLSLAPGQWLAAVRAERIEHLPAETWTFQGRVYAGEVGDESRPLQGVTISVYGGNNPHPAEGTLIRTTTTNGDGWYGLPVYDDDGNLCQVDSPTADKVFVAPARVASCHWIKLWSQDGSAANTNQAGDRVLTLGFKA